MVKCSVDERGYLYHIPFRILIILHLYYCGIDGFLLEARHILYEKGKSHESTRH